MRRLLGVALLLAGCTSNDVQLYAVDFGVVAVGEVHEAPLRVRNDSRGPEKLIRVEQRDGARGFTVVPRFQPIEAGAETTWSVQFDAVNEGPATARFAAIFEHGESEVQLSARGAPRCDVAPVIDFEGTNTRTFELSNPTSQPARVEVGGVSAPFSIDVHGSVLLAANETRSVTLRFAEPSGDGVAAQAWSVQTRADCAPTTVQLHAERRARPLQVSPGRLFFADSLTDLLLTVSNTSSRALQLTELSIVGAGYSLDDASPREVPAKGSVTLSVRRSDFTTRALAGELVLRTDAAVQPELRVPLLAKHGAECVTASTQAVTFSGVEERCHAASTRLVLTNECPHAVGFATPSVAAPFVIVAAASRGVIAAGATLPLDVSFAPTEAGQFVAPLRVDIDVLDGTQKLQVPLFGDARAMTMRQDVQRTPSFHTKLDVLFVIDDSARMAPHADSMRTNLGSFARFLPTQFSPVRVAVMTTSTAAGSVGRLRRLSSGGAWLDNPSSTELQALTAWRGTQTGRSSCLEALDVAFHSALRTDPTELGGFLRPDAALQLICITNGTDEVETPPMLTISRLLQSVPKPMSFAVIARFDDELSCAGEMESGALESFAMQVNGVREDLCTLNWAVAFERIGKTSFGSRTSYFLSATPALNRAPLRVWFDDVEIPSRDPDPHLGALFWTYESSSNSVHFEPIYAPVGGTLLRFEYAPSCAP